MSGKTISTKMLVPFNDLHAQYLTIKSEIDSAIAEVVSESSFIRGRHVKSFEENFSSLIGVQNCVACGNGTDAIYIVLKMLGIGKGDEVITTAHSWISTSEAISQTGATVVFVDTDADTFTIDPEEVRKKVNSKTKAIIPVHLYGHPADMDPVMEIAREHGLFVIEDCAQSHLAEYKGRMTGTIGHAATFSFYPGKNLGAFGDAGAIVTNESALAEACRRYANHGALSKHDHVYEGINSRMDGIQAAVLNVKIKYIKEWTNKRISLAKEYGDRLKNHGSIAIPVCSPLARHVYHLYVIKTRLRDQLHAELERAGISTAIQYPVALPFLEAYSERGYSKDQYSRAYKNQGEILSLPLYPEMSLDQVDQVCQKLHEFHH